MTDFSQSLANLLFDSPESFPVDFDLAWQWLGYFDKPTAKRALLNCSFVEEIDFRINAALSTASDPRPKEHITLSVDCFKTWGMMAGTKQGKQVRLYFLNCEKVAKSKILPVTAGVLATFEKDGLELVIDTATGECFATRSSLALLCAAGESQICRGKNSQLFDEDEIFAELDRCNPMAVMGFASWGMRNYLHRLGGFAPLRYGWLG